MLSEVESRRFGRRVSRNTFESIDSQAVRAIQQARPDLAIVRFPSSELAHVHRLAMFGASPIVADTLVYYGCELASTIPRPLRNTALEFRRADSSRTDDLRGLVNLIFRDYRNHYVSNPTLDHEAILAGYVEWGLSFVSSRDRGVAWIVYLNDRPVAFANCSSDGDVFEGVLYGVHPEFAGQGIYGDLIAFTQAHAKEQQFRRMVVSTQIDNLAVQKAWVRQGFFLERPLNTVHLNLFLSDEHSLDELRERVTITSELCAQGGLAALVARVLARFGECVAQSGAHLASARVGDEVVVHVLLKLRDAVSGRLVASTRVHRADGELAFCGQATLVEPGVAGRPRS